MDYIVFDGETTGLARIQGAINNPQSLKGNGDEIIQIGGIILDESFTPKRMFCHYCDCLLPGIDTEASAINRIDMSMVRQQVPNVFIEEVVETLVPELCSDNVTLIGYNIDFDINMMAQSLRDAVIKWKPLNKVSTRIPRQGRNAIDVMKYLPKRVKLVSFYDALTEPRNTFYRLYADKLTIETNCVEMLEETWSSAHNSLFDSIETYLLFMDQILGKKLFT